MRTVLFLLFLPAVLLAQPAPAPPKPAPVRQRPPDFPQRAAGDPAAIERGKALYGVQCQFCHGVDARGGSGGINLIRNQTVLNDKQGELIGPVLRAGRDGMPKFENTDTQNADLAAFLHSFKVGGYDVSRMTPETIVVGDAKAGEQYFAKTCGGCHSVTGDLKAIGARIKDPKALQQSWLMPGAGRFGGGPPPVRAPQMTATVTPAGGGKAVKGRLVRIDDFIVTVIDADGARRSFTRNGDVPQVEVHDPLKPHRDLLPKYQDKDIHNVTAYLVTVQ